MKKTKMKKVKAMNEFKKGSFNRILLGTRYIGDKKKAFFFDKDYFSTGYIIGDGYYYEGDYKIGRKGSFDDDYEQAELINRKRINFYIVVMGYNEIVKVLKSDFKKDI